MAFALTLGGVTFMLAVIWGSPLVEIMRRMKLGKQIRIEGPQTHMVKMGTPAMGGILIVGWVVLIAVVINSVQIVRNLEIAEAEFGELRQELAAVIENELPQLESDLESAGAPWTPGRRLPAR